MEKLSVVSRLTTEPLCKRCRMPMQFADLITTNQSAGVLIVSKKLAIDAVIEELLLIWEASSAQEWINRIAKIPL